MKLKILLVTALFFGLEMVQSELKAQELTFDFTTVNLAGHKRSPKHVFAVWVTDSNNEFVNTLMVYAAKRIGYLAKFNSASGGFKTDAITGATLSKHTSHQATWNMKDFLGNTIPNGDYNIVFEMSSGESSNLNPFYNIPFTIDGNSFSITPEDKANLVSMTLAYDNGQSTSTLNIDAQKALKVFPNPASQFSMIQMEGFVPGNYVMEIFDLKGALIYSKLVGVDSDAQLMRLPAETLKGRNELFVIRMNSGEEIFQTSFFYNPK